MSRRKKKIKNNLNQKTMQGQNKKDSGTVCYITFWRWFSKLKLSFKVGFIAAIMGLIGFSMDCLWHQDETKQKAGIQNVEDKQDKIMALLQSKKESLQGKLKNEYPLGYVLSYINGDKIIFDKGNSSLKVDWQSMKILKSSDQEIVFQMPTFCDKNHNCFDNITVALSRKEGVKATIVQTYNMGVGAEYISTESDGDIVVFGFYEVK